MEWPQFADDAAAGPALDAGHVTCMGVALV